MLHRILNIAWLTLAALLLLAAVFLAAARLWVPSLAEYRDDIAREAGAVLGRELRIGHLEASLRGLQPVLELHDVTIVEAQTGDSVLQLEQVQVRPDIMHLLRNRAVRISGIDIIGTELTLVRDEAGAYVVEGFAGGRGDLSELSAMTRLSLLESQLVVRDLGSELPAQRLSMVNLVVRNHGTAHRVSGHAYLPDDVGYRIELNGSFRGAGIDPRDWRGRLYVEGQKLSLPLILGQLMEHNPVRSGIADLRLWLDLADGKLVRAISELGVHDVAVEDAGTARLVQVDAADLRAGWQHLAGGWTGQLAVLSASVAGQAWQPFEVTLLQDRAGLRQYSRVVADRLVLDDLQALLPLLQLAPEGAMAAYASSQAGGELHDLDVLLLHRDDGTHLGGLRAGLHDISLARAAGLPAVAGLDGRVDASEEGGEISLASQGVAVTDDRYFRETLSFLSLDGTVSWQVTDGGVTVTAPALALANDDLALHGHFTFLQPADAAAELDLSLDLERLSVASVKHYLPAKVMHARGVHWLDRSLVGGESRGGSVRLSGRLDQVPFDNGEGTLEVRLPVTGATLDFNPDWTPVTELDAEVRFTGRRMDIRSERGRIRTASLHGVHARIPDVIHRPHLSIDGEVRGALPVMLAELGSSPLGDRYGGFVDRALTRGNAGLVLDLDVPLTSHDGEITAAGRILLDGNDLRLQGSDFDLAGISGELAFDDNGIHGDALHARLNGHAATATVRTDTENPVTYIRLNGRLGLLPDLLGDLYGDAGPVRGSADWQVEVALRGTPVRGEPANVGLRLASGLEGVSVGLPAPFGKAADTSRAFELVVKNTEAAPQEVTLGWGNVLSGRLLLERGNDGMQLQRGAIVLGGDTVELPANAGLHITGRLQQVRLADWLELLGKGGGGPETQVHTTLAIDRFELLGYRLDGLQLDITRAGRQWQIDADGEQSRGRVQLEPGDGRLDHVVMNMERLALAPVDDDATEDVAELPAPAAIPALQVNVQQLVYKGADFGQLELKTLHDGNDAYRVERLVVSSGLLEMRLNGNWEVHGGAHRSEIELNIEHGRMEQLLDVFGYEKTFKDGDLYGTLTASWPSAIWDFTPAGVDGRLHVVIKKGQLLELEPGAPGRVLGLLSLTRLPKRLTLDFSDLFGKGFGFDRIGGKFSLENGNAYTEDLEIDGSSARIGITGRVGLGARDYDELVTVTPYLESSLPLAGAIVGGPAVGAAAMVAEKLLEGRLGLNRLARKQYTVTGSWDEPVVTELKSGTAPGGDEAAVTAEDTDG